MAKNTVDMKPTLFALNVGLDTDAEGNKLNKELKSQKGKREKGKREGDLFS